ncbi:MAG: hypothetical protein Q8L57_03295, partial [bacterium]|nr:hypothetical protein [bacterium]
AVQSEYSANADLIDRLARGELTLSEVLDFSSSLFVSETGKRGGTLSRLEKTAQKTPYFLKPNQTKRIFADFFREFMSDISKSCPEFSQEKEEFSVYTYSGFYDYLSPNIIGRKILDISLVSLRGILIKKCDQIFAARGTAILIALKDYKQKNGKLPDS